MAQTTGILFDIRKYSIHDGPGIRTAVFFKGCPLRCQWCHNPESQVPQPELMLRPSRCIGCEACLAVCPHGAIFRQDSRLVTERAKCQVSGSCAEMCYAEARQVVGRAYTVDEVMAIIERDRVFYEQSEGGVTFSGGEPLMQARFLLAVLQAARQANLHTALDTCGYVSWKTLEQVRPYVNLFLYDLKLMDDRRHRQYTGVSNERILSNLRQLSRLNHTVIVRFPVIPSVNDDAENLEAMARFVADLPQVQRVDVLPYHNSAETKYSGLGKPYLLGDIRSPTQERMQAVAVLFQQYGLPVQVR